MLCAQCVDYLEDAVLCFWLLLDFGRLRVEIERMVQGV
jgi:hypothetical protein